MWRIGQTVKDHRVHTGLHRRVEELSRLTTYDTSL